MVRGLTSVARAMARLVRPRAAICRTSSSRSVSSPRASGSAATAALASRRRPDRRSALRIGGMTELSSAESAALNSRFDRLSATPTTWLSCAPGRVNAIWSSVGMWRKYSQ